jgi:aldose 1-epimerase
MEDGIAGKAGQIYNHRGGFCLETQHFPDSPNRPDFPSTVLEPGSTYDHTTIYQFTAV